MAKRVFIQNPDSGEPAAYCGSADDLDLMTSIGYFIKSEIDQATGSDEKEVNLVLTFKEMSDDEVEELSEM